MGIKKPLIAVRGGGDLASGVVARLHRCGFDVVILETDSPTAIRRTVAFCMAVYEGAVQVEEIKAVLCGASDVKSVIEQGLIPVVIDKKCEKVKADILVDAIIAKKNLGTTKDMAEYTIALGPGFCAGSDVHAVIETKRGHSLGRVLYEGYAEKDTGVPGEIGGRTAERVIHSPVDGGVSIIRDIGSLVYAYEMVAMVGDTAVTAPFAGLVRGMIYDGTEVAKGMKIADIDPREDEYRNCFTFSDKALAIGGGVLEAVMAHLKERIWTS